MTSLFSTGHKVRKSDRHSARVSVGAGGFWGQDSLGPYPPAVCGRRVGVFSFDGSTAVFFLGHQKEYGGGKWPGFPGTTGWSTGHRRGVGDAAPYEGDGPPGSSCPAGVRVAGSLLLSFRIPGTIKG